MSKVPRQGSVFRMPTHDEMRKQFYQLGREIAEIRATARPHRERYEDKRREIEEKRDRELRPLKKVLLEAEAQLHVLQQEQAVLSRALGGRVGAPPPSDQ